MSSNGRIQLSHHEHILNGDNKAFVQTVSNFNLFLVCSHLFTVKDLKRCPLFFVTITLMYL